MIRTSVFVCPTTVCDEIALGADSGNQIYSLGQECYKTTTSSNRDIASYMYMYMYMHEDLHVIVM